MEPEQQVDDGEYAVITPEEMAAKAANRRMEIENQKTFVEDRKTEVADLKEVMGGGSYDMEKLSEEDGGKRKSRTHEILRDERYARFQGKYYDNLVQYVLDHSRHVPTWQQMQLYEAASKPGCRVAVSSGHGTGSERGAGMGVGLAFKSFSFFQRASYGNQYRTGAFSCVEIS